MGISSGRVENPSVAFVARVGAAGFRGCTDSCSHSAPKYDWELSRLWERPEGAWDMAGIDVHRSLGLSKVRNTIYFNRD